MFRNLTLAIVLIAVLLTCKTSFAEPLLRVRIIYTLSEIDFQPKCAWNITGNGINMEIRDTVFHKIKLENGMISLLDEKSKPILSSSSFHLTSCKDGGELKIKKVPYGIGWWWAGVQDRIYEGSLDVKINSDNKLDVIVSVPIETYLCGVIPSEIGTEAPLEALKAQAVAARSETVVALRNGMYKGDGFDICADVDCQVYSGNTLRKPNTDQAVKETAALALFTGDKPINGYFASNCGGVSENIENVWPDRSGAVPYFSSCYDEDSTFSADLTKENELIKFIESSPKVYCNVKYNPGLSDWSRKNFRWTVERTVDSLSKTIALKKDIGTLKEIKVLKRGVSGRIIKADFVGEKGVYTVNTELQFRQAWVAPLRSSCCYITLKDGKVIAKGAGWGHGVGMCQSGAVGMSLKGKTFIQILNHYYRTAEIKKAY